MFWIGWVVGVISAFVFSTSIVVISAKIYMRKQSKKVWRDIQNIMSKDAQS